MIDVQLTIDQPRQRRLNPENRPFRLLLVLFNHTLSKIWMFFLLSSTPGIFHNILYKIKVYIETQRNVRGMQMTALQSFRIERTEFKVELLPRPNEVYRQFVLRYSSVYITVVVKRISGCYSNTNLVYLLWLYTYS